ncbi:hypothetical protein BAE44_0003028 [Dichanthelium oligosanthes]|uniref:NRR repressor homolog 1 n=1 Tax=Dichanthelium oligosanthes TaxID=888268 RepID=A0A1E5WEY4_9POAL|nr:hypothetical protein BAE44_0003028 [Dichanthelium oligosanthes]
MGAGGGEETKKALQITAIDGDGASARAPVPPVEQRRPAPSLPAAAASGVAASSGGSAAAVQSCGEEDDDKQVERFYALLANIRALRGLYRGEDGGGRGLAAGRGRKRPREPEAPWRPAFRMEDFEEEVSHVTTADARCAVMKQGASGAGVARRPAAGRARAADGDYVEDEVADEARGRKLGRRVAARG